MPLNKSFQYLISNTEFSFDANLIGFELYTLTAGYITINVYKFTSCGLSQTCSSYFDKNKLVPKANFKVVYSFDFNVTIGYNKLEIAPVYLLKGSILGLNLSSTGVLAFDKMNSFIYSDYVISDNKDGSKTLSKIRNDSASYGIYLRALTDYKYYYYEQPFSHEYIIAGLYNLSASLAFTNYTNSYFLLIMDGK